MVYYRSMHPNFWKYFAAISIFSCLFVGVAAILWQYSGFPTLSAVTTVNKGVYKQKEREMSQNNTVEQFQTVPDNTKHLVIIAAGDIMLDRTMLLLAQKYNDFGYAFGLISSTLKKADLRVANLEGPITTNKSISNGAGGVRFSFTFSPKVVDPLKHNFDIVSLANNHTTNFGFEGLAQTRDFLNKGPVLHFGDPMNKAGNISTIVERNGIKIGFVGYHQLVETGFENVITEIKKIRPEVDLIIAYPHWGIEYVTNTPSVMQKKDGHTLVDAGVDIVIGAHPHVIEPVELYKGKPIFYSVGNFIFDQYFSLETMQGLTLKINLEKRSEDMYAQIELVPVHISKESQPFVAEAPEREQILSSLSTVSIGDAAFKESVKTGSVEMVFPLTDAK